MAAWCRILVVLLFLLVSTEHSFADVDQNRLALLVNGILREYGVKGMFSLAVKIPDNQNQNIDQIIRKVLKSDPANNVKEEINEGHVYVGSRVVAAKPKPKPLEYWTDHAESRVVDHLPQLFNKHQVNDQDLLLFYVYASPCVEKCTNANHQANILDRIHDIQRWKRYAVVFSKIFKPNSGEENTVKERKTALLQLANYIGDRSQGPNGPIGQNNIFRCDKEKNWMQCVGCFHNGEVKHRCVSDDPQSGTSRSKTSASIYNHPQPGTGGSSPQTGVVSNMNTDEGWITVKSKNKRRGREVRDVSDNTGDGSSQGILEGNKGAEDASSVDGKGSEVATGEGVCLSQTGSDDGKGSDLSRADDVSSSQIGFDFGRGNGEVRGRKGKKGKWRGGKGKKGKWRGGKGKKGKWRGGKGKKGKMRGGKGKKGKMRGGKGKKGKWSRRGGRNRTRGRRRRPGLDQVWMFEK